LHTSASFPFVYFIAEKSVAKHAAGIFSRLGLAPSDDDNRRVLAVLAYLNG